MLKPIFLGFLNTQHSQQVESKINKIVITIDSSVGGYETIVDGYSIKGSIVLASLFFQKFKRNPKPNDEVTFVVEENVAVVGDTVLTPAISFLNWGGSKSVKLINKGLIVGRGGTCGLGTKGEDTYAENQYIGMAKGGVGIQSASEFPTVIENYGTISCGGNSSYYLWRMDNGKFASFGYPYGGAPFGKSTYQKGDTHILGAEDATLLVTGICYLPNNKKYVSKMSIGEGNGGRNFAITKGNYELININQGKTIGYV